MKTAPKWVIIIAVLMAAALPAETQETTKKRELRKPGFIFLELGTQRVAEYVDYFHTVLGYDITHQEPGYATLQSDVAQLLLMDPPAGPKVIRSTVRPPAAGKASALRLAWSWPIWTRPTPRP